MGYKHVPSEIGMRDRDYLETSKFGNRDHVFWDLYPVKLRTLEHMFRKEKEKGLWKPDKALWRLCLTSVDMDTGRALFEYSQEKQEMFHIPNFITCDRSYARSPDECYYLHKMNIFLEQKDEISPTGTYHSWTSTNSMWRSLNSGGLHRK